MSIVQSIDGCLEAAIGAHGLAEAELARWLDALVPGLEIPFVPDDPNVSRTWLTLTCAAAAVLGHVYPIYHGFKGGKGAGTYIGTLLVLVPKMVIGLGLVWAWILVMSGFVGLATMVAAASLPAYIGAAILPDQQPLFIYTVIIASGIIYWHRSNIQRMRDGTEHRNEKVMLFRRRGSSDADT